MNTKKTIGYVLIIIELALLAFLIELLQFTLSEAGKKAINDGKAEDAAFTFIFLIGLVIILGFSTFRYLIRPQVPYEQQGIVIAGYPIASIKSRFGASLIDAIMVLPIILAAYFIPPNNPILMLVILVLNHLLFFYDLLFDWLTGQTIGKKILGIRVLTSEGHKLSLSQAALRSILYIGPSIASLIVLYLSRKEIQSGGLLNLSYSDLLAKLGKDYTAYDLSGYALLGLFFVDISVLIISRQKRAWHDYLSKTIVVKA